MRILEHSRILSIVGFSQLTLVATEIFWCLSHKDSKFEQNKGCIEKTQKNFHIPKVYCVQSSCPEGIVEEESSIPFNTDYPAGTIAHL